MAETLVPTVRTTPTMLQYARAAIVSCEGISKESTAVMWAQFSGETGVGVYCWNWNLGNVKHVRGDGHNYVSLKGVWEGVTPAQAEKLIASGQWTKDTNPDHIKAVGPGMVSVVANANNPATWFRAFDSLDEGMQEHVTFLSSKRWAPAWEAVMAGDYALFAKRLKALGYYSASEAAYANQLRQHYAKFMASTEWERAIALLKDEGAAEMSVQPIIHPHYYFEPRTLNDDDEGNV